MNEVKDVYKIINNSSNETVSVRFPPTVTYETEFDSITEARNANYSGEYKEKDKYRIAKYKVTYELIDDDCDPITKKDQEIIDKRIEKESKRDKAINAKAIELYNKEYDKLDFADHMTVLSVVMSDEFFEVLENALKDDTEGGIE